MSEIDKYEAQKKKLDGLCEEHDLTYRFRHDSYPITLTIKPLMAWRNSSPCWRQPMSRTTSPPMRPW